MRLEVIAETDALFEKAIYIPVCEPVEFRERYIHILKQARDNKTECLLIRSIDKQEKTSADFQYMGIAEKAIMEFLKENEYPCTVKILCKDKEMATTYRAVYNFWFADEKHKRMDDETF